MTFKNVSVVCEGQTEVDFIKKLNNVYVIQVGSFASLNKAQILVNQLAQHGFQARIVEE